jgi:D-alanyl-D-alanine dipeptidase
MEGLSDTKNDRKQRIAGKSLALLLIVTLIIALVISSACSAHTKEDTEKVSSKSNETSTDTYPTTSAGALLPPTPTESAISAETGKAPTPSTVTDSATTPRADGSPDAPIDSASANTEKNHDTNLPDGFVYVRDLNPNIRVDLRYAGTHNFTGSVVDGYYSTDAAILKKNAARSLSRVQKYLEKKGYGLLIYDAYRPEKSVACFVAWSQNDDTSAKEEFYPSYKKSQLFKLGYIARRSNHSRGIAVDLTLVDIKSGLPLDMGGPFDFFGDISHMDATGLTDEQEKNRGILRNAMERYEFSPYSKEWWHFSFGNSSDSYDFDVR